MYLFTGRLQHEACCCLLGHELGKLEVESIEIFFMGE